MNIMMMNLTKRNARKILGNNNKATKCEIKIKKNRRFLFSSTLKKLTKETY